MNQYRCEGIEKDSGAKTFVFVQADNQDDAVAKANKKGVLVDRTILIQPDLFPTFNSAGQAITEAVGQVPSVSGILLIIAGIITLIVACNLEIVKDVGDYSRHEYVYNIGLIANRELTFLFGIMFIIVGELHCGIKTLASLLEKRNT